LDLLDSARRKLTEVRCTCLTDHATVFNICNTGYSCGSPEGIETLDRKETAAAASSYYLRPVVAFRMTRRLGAGTVVVCSAAGPDVIADDDLSAGQLAEPAVTGIVLVEIGVDGVSAPRSPMTCADLSPGTRDSTARSPCG
jgi:hypothetical protein